KVIDFGIAKVREDAGLGFTGMLTATTGYFVGTPEYASPEQASGVRGNGLDGRTDLYSLGLVLYEMLTGQLPFRAETPMGILVQRLQVKPGAPHLSRPDLNIPEQVSAIVLKALQTDREDRFASAKLMSEAIAETIVALQAERERRAREETERLALAQEQERLAREKAERKERERAEAIRQAELREQERLAQQEVEQKYAALPAQQSQESFASESAEAERRWLEWQRAGRERDRSEALKWLVFFLVVMAILGIAIARMH
ncbi:MAG TPA: hypothetical protein VKE70_25610, partial [Candidatus Solibacter sp.]|nr:hypothetical protein [Candidatus Solibacter sp.]